MIDNLTAQLIRDEGLRLKPYKDSRGFLTIGIGRNLDANGISYSEAISMASSDIFKVRFALIDFSWFRGLDEVRQAAIINMGFNLGATGLLEFKDMITCLGAGDYSGAAKAMLSSKWATEVGERAIRLAAQIQTGEWA